jgi:hypothetical protein
MKLSWGALALALVGVAAAKADPSPSSRRASRRDILNILSRVLHER